MAGAGYKLFVNGNALSASDLNTYVQQQTVMVFASASARTTALSGVLAEGMVSYRTDSHVFEVYNGTSWVSAGASSPLTTKGDLWGYNTADARVPVGTDGQLLKADSTNALGVSWTTVSSGGMTLLSTTTLSGASTTISGINQSYTNLFIQISGLNISAAYNEVYIRANATANVCTFEGWNGGGASGGGAGLTGATNSDLNAGIGRYDTSGTNNALTLQINNYSNTSYPKTFSYYGIGSNNQAYVFYTTGQFYPTTAISSLYFYPTSSITFTAGQVLIYGVK